MDRLYCCIFSVWACEAIIPSYWLRTRDGDALPQVSFWIGLIIILVGVILAHTHDRVSILIFHTPRVLHNHNVIRVSAALVGLGGSMGLGWSGLLLAASAVLLLLVLGWTPLPDSGWTCWRLHPLLRLLCLWSGPCLSCSTSPILVRGSHSPPPSMRVVSCLAMKGADLTYP